MLDALDITQTDSELNLKDLWQEFRIVEDIVANICRLLSSNILHQLIKETFKDHLGNWIEKYLVITHGRKAADKILDNIDHHIAAVPSFAGWHFKQWTGDDSKALMKVYLAAIKGHIPCDMLRTFQAFLKFCYFIRKDVISTMELAQVEEALSHFHRYL
ncbi:hypothetical protein HD554DRAFT_2037097 [Boletus coccyginus]|nr:hypothetical protein HD554DRAFT_2037097 [Boletus coccyginus]